MKKEVLRNRSIHKTVGEKSPDVQILKCSSMDSFQFQEATGEDASSSNSDAGVYKCEYYKPKHGSLC